MKTILISMITFLFLISGCASSVTTVIKEKPSDHQHFYPNAKSAGDFHIINFMDRRSSKIGIQILDRYERPYFLAEEKIKAKITHKNGTVEEISLRGEGYSEELDDLGYTYRGATVYSERFAWVKNEHSVNMKVWVPLPDGKIYELTFKCTAYEQMPGHSGITLD